eukprot:841373-Rhodomonas_salina.1
MICGTDLPRRRQCKHWGIATANRRNGRPELAGGEGPAEVGEGVGGRGLALEVEVWLYRLADSVQMCTPYSRRSTNAHAVPSPQYERARRTLVSALLGRLCYE